MATGWLVAGVYIDRGRVGDSIHTHADEGPCGPERSRHGKRTGAGAMLFPGRYASVSKPKEPENSGQS